MVLNYISLVNSGVETLYMYYTCFLAIGASSLDKCLFKFFARFKMGLFVLLSCMSSLYILDTKSNKYYEIFIK